MPTTPSAQPNLLVVGSDYTAIGDGTNYHLPIMCYNYSAKQVEGYYLTVGAGAAGTLGVGTSPLGTAFNVATEVIATLCYPSGSAGIQVRLFNTGSMTPAFSNSAANFAGAVKCAPYATVSTLTDTNVSDASNAFIVPYTSTHFLVVTPQRCWRVRISDGGIENQFAIDPGNASYSRLNLFAVSSDVIPSPMPMANGRVAICVTQVRNAANTSNVSVTGLLIFDPATGATTASNYSIGSYMSAPGALIPMPDNSVVLHRGTGVLKFNDATLATTSGIMSGAPSNPWTYGNGASAQDEWWFFRNNSGMFPWKCNIVAGAVTHSSAFTDSSNASYYAYVILGHISSTRMLLRRTTSAGTGTSIGSYISVREKATGAVASGFTEVQMIDTYSGNAVSGSGFNNKTFARLAYGITPDPTLYTVREVLGLMVDEPTLATPSVSAVQVGANAEVTIAYTPDPNDALEGFLVYIGSSATPDWGSATDVGLDQTPSIPNALTGTVYVAVRAYSTTESLTEDSDVESFFVQPPTLATPTVSAEQVGENAEITIGYTPGTGDALEGFLVYIGSSPTPNWTFATDVGLDYNPVLDNDLTGTIYVAVRAYGASLTSDSSVASFYVEPPEEPEVPSVAADWAMAMAGETMAGGVPVLGVLANLSATSPGRESVTVTWEHKDIPQETPVRVQWYADGYPVADSFASEGVVGVTGLTGDIDHSLLHVLLPVGAEVPARILDAGGNRAAIHWAPSSDETARAYRVYNMAGSPELVAEVTEQRVQERIKQQPDIGSGFGRITTFGAVPAGTEVNGTMVLKVLGSGEVEWTWNETETGTFDFVPGSTTQLMHGLTVVFNDETAAYDTNDTWNIHIGPATEYVTEPLEPGDYTFGVSALDEAGNESDIIEGGVVRIFAVPEPVDTDTIVYEYGAGAVTVTWQVPTGALGVRVYTNWDKCSETFTDRIITNGLPHEQVVAPANSWTFDPGGAEGTLKFYLRPYDAEDEREDITLHEFSFPPTPDNWGILLGSPSGLTATPLAGGKWAIEFAYLVQDTDSQGNDAEDAIEEFRVYVTPADTAIDYEATPTAVIEADTGEGGPLLRFRYEHPTAAEEPIRISVRASDGSIEDTNTDYVVLTPDASAPTFSGPVGGGAA